ncbi:CPBP family intramembrane metalloprotease [bacterium]|nr:CPBP family intramembrane metalloprotease [bacterium]
MKNQTKLFLEFLTLFVILPMALCLSIGIWIKVTLGLLGFGFVVSVLSQEKYTLLKGGAKGFPTDLKKQIITVLALLIPATIFFVYIYDSEQLFYVVRNNPIVWVVIFFVYSFMSVLPQEVLYRSFFFHRYRSLFTNNVVLVLINALVFSLGHLFFENTLVLVITFLGGLIFGYTYLKTKSLRLVFIEHTIYGYWLFTVGMGDMLGFPGG